MSAFVFFGLCIAVIVSLILNILQSLSISSMKRTMSNQTLNIDRLRDQVRILKLAADGSQHTFEVHRDSCSKLLTQRPMREEVQKMIETESERVRDPAAIVLEDRIDKLEQKFGWVEKKLESIPPIIDHKKYFVHTHEFIPHRRQKRVTPAAAKLALKQVQGQLREL